MAPRPVTIRLIACLAAALADVAFAAPEPVALTLREAEARRHGDFVPAYNGVRVKLAGTVSLRAVQILDYFHLPIQENGYGFILESHTKALDSFRPGDEIEAIGTISSRAGLPVLQPEFIRKTGTGHAPEPARVGINELDGFRRLGTLVSLETTVIAPGENVGGEVLTIGSREHTLRVFLPREARRPSLEFTRFRPGDRVRIVGISSQYCASAPYNRNFQILISDAATVALLERSWFISPESLAAGLAVILAALGFWWRRERIMARQRSGMRTLMGLAEDVVAASTPAEISRAIAAVLPRSLHAADTELYLFNRAQSTLEPVRDDSEATPLSVNSPIGGLSSAIALCFRNRAMLVVPDTRSSPLFQRDQSDLPAAAVFAPMLSRQEVVGVLSLTFASRRELAKDEQAAVQHVANQIATSLKLQEQKVMREQLLRSEKMAATGQLISGVANELRVPLQSIKTLAHDLTASVKAANGTADMHAIAYEADRAVGILSRLVSFGNVELGQAETVDVAAILRHLIEFRRREWETKRVTWETSVPAEPLLVLGVATQLEQVILNLLISAETAVSGQPERRVALAAAHTGSTVVVGIEFTGPAQAAVESPSADTGALGIQVCQAIVQSYGGELRLRSVPPHAFRFEIELPAHEAEPEEQEDRAPVRAARLMTVLIVDPEVNVQRRLMSLLAERGHRSIPVVSAEEGLDLSHRLRFDVVFCAVRLSGLNWVEFLHKVRRNIPSFVLVTDGFDESLSKSFKAGEGYLLNRSLDAGDVDQVLMAIESRQETGASRS